MAPGLALSVQDPAEIWVHGASMLSGLRSGFGGAGDKSLPERIEAQAPPGAQDHQLPVQHTVDDDQAGEGLLHVTPHKDLLTVTRKILPANSPVGPRTTWLAGRICGPTLVPARERSQPISARCPSPNAEILERQCRGAVSVRGRAISRARALWIARRLRYDLG